MPNYLDNTPEWVDDIRQLELTDPATGGPGGLINVQADGLTKRTAFLKAQLDSGAFVPVVAGDADGPSALAADADTRGAVVRIEGGAGVGDSVWVALKLANDTYDWVQLV